MRDECKMIQAPTSTQGLNFQVYRNLLIVSTLIWDKLTQGEAPSPVVSYQDLRCFVIGKDTQIKAQHISCSFQPCLAMWRNKLWTARRYSRIQWVMQASDLDGHPSLLAGAGGWRPMEPLYMSHASGSLGDADGIAATGSCSTTHTSKCWVPRIITQWHPRSLDWEIGIYSIWPKRHVLHWFEAIFGSNLQHSNQENSVSKWIHNDCMLLTIAGRLVRGTAVQSIQFCNLQAYLVSM